MSSGVVLDPATFEPVVGFLTRYGYVEVYNTASSVGTAADYLGKGAITHAKVSYKYSTAKSKTTNPLRRVFCCLYYKYTVRSGRGVYAVPTA